LAPPEDPERPFQIPRDGFAAEPRPPSPEHPFGTTEGQYDIYYGVIWGTRTAFIVGLTVVGASILIGLIIGSLSGYYGGWVDEVLMRVTDVILAFPGLILAVAFSIAFGRSLESVMIAIILVSWPTYARLLRGDILQVKQETYVEAAKAIGASDTRIIIRHILPNAIYPLFVVGTLDIGSIVLLAAALSFLGIGAPVGYADWGQMISMARNWIIGPPHDPLRYWYTWTIPGIFIILFVLGWNLIGDAFRDILDPKIRRR
ncbi:MAG TPA: ABC transporter permease, partial [Candidatus Caldiarchaeum subterraneum]|nr:ABC transporter permease [Candidatus Caldarchaeum subterraneum]